MEGSVNLRPVIDEEAAEPVVAPFPPAPANQFNEYPGKIDQINTADPTLGLKIDELDHVSFNSLPDFLSREGGITDAYVSQSAYGCLYPNLTVVFLANKTGYVRGVMPVSDGELTLFYQGIGQRMEIHDLDQMQRGNPITAAAADANGEMANLLEFKKGDGSESGTSTSAETD